MAYITGFFANDTLTSVVSEFISNREAQFRKFATVPATAYEFIKKIDFGFRIVQN